MPPPEIISLTVLPSLNFMPCGGDTIIILTNKSENLRTLSLEEEMESLSVVKSTERLLSVS